MNVKDFQNRFMQLVNGQMPLPQSVFRQFLEWLQGQSAADTSAAVSGKVDKVASATEGNVAFLNEDGSIKDNGITLDSFLNDHISYDDMTGCIVIKVGNETYKVAVVQEQ